jgi:hypothetical protein
MDWIVSIKGSLVAALQWFEAHPGTASWLDAVGSIVTIAFVSLFALFLGLRTRSHESTDRIRRAQGLALVFVPVLTDFMPKIEAAIIQKNKLEPPDEVLYFLDHLYVLGTAGGLILQMIAALQANRQTDPLTSDNENARLSDALHYCEDALAALMKLTRVRTA